VLLFVAYVLAARALGDAGFGEFSVGMTVALVLSALPTWGTARYSSILAAREPERTEHLLATSLGLIALLSLVYLPLVWLAGSMLGDGGVVAPVALILGVDALAREYGNLLRLLMRVHGEFVLDTISVFAERGLMTAAALGVIFAAPDPILLAAAFAAGRSLGVSVTAAFYRARIGPIGVRFDREPLRGIWSGGTPLAIRRGIAEVAFRVDMLFLGAFRAAQEAGWYGSVYRLMDGVLMLPSIITGSLGPTLSANFAEGRLEVVNRLYRRGVKYLLITGLFLAAVFGILAEPIVRLLFGEDFLPAAGALRILSPAVVFVFLRRHATEVLDNMDLRKATVWIYTGALVANLLLNLVLVPRYGYLGAAVATSVAEGYLIAAMMWALLRAGQSPLALSELGAIMVSVTVASAVMWSLIATPVWAVGAAGAAYLILLTLFRAWDEKDRLLARSVLRGAMARFR
jgi:O-antigen/teichoic acid export membrane protein